MRSPKSFYIRATQLLLCLAMLAGGIAVQAQTGKTQPVTLQGQLVCSLCWFEADRKTTPYGSPADIECAKDCAGKNIPPAVAVTEADGFKLYVIEAKDFQKHKATWIDYVGQRVEVTGRTRSKDKKDYVAVDELRLLPARLQDESQAPSVVGSEPDLALKDLFGIEQRLSGYRGKIVVLNFWATWCVPCRQEMPDLAAIQNEYAALGVQVIGAAADSLGDRPKVMQFVKETKINFPIWLGVTTADMKRFGLGPALPGTAILSREGKILWLSPTVITHAALKKQIESLLAGDARAVKEIAERTHGPVEASMVPS